jgi:integrase
MIELFWQNKRDLATIEITKFCCQAVAKGGRAMAREKLTDRKLKSLKPAPEGKHKDYWDSSTDGSGVLGVRVSDTGRRTFVLMARYPRNPSHPQRVALGTYPTMSLADAREKASRWRKLIAASKDPRDEEEKKKENSFRAVGEQFIDYIKRQKLRTAPVMEHRLRQTFMEKWGGRPISEITADDIKRIIRKSVEDGARYQAFHHFALIRRLFNWAIGTDDYGIQVNPCDRLNSGDLIGERHARDRVLTDDELRALWRATERMGYPYGPLYRLLALTGLRLNEACGAQWSEFDLKRREWTIPAARMKKVKGGAKPFMVPLTDKIMEVLDSIDRFKSGDFLFSHSHGKQPLKPNQFSDIKERLDAIVLEELKQMATEARKDAKRVTLPDFVNHDIRRTVRTHLSALRIGEEVREAVLAHVRPGIKGVYDQHAYLEEKREALTLWNARLWSIVMPPADNVVDMRATR